MMESHSRDIVGSIQRKKKKKKALMHSSVFSTVKQGKSLALMGPLLVRSNGAALDKNRVTNQDK